MPARIIRNLPTALRRIAPEEKAKKGAWALLWLSLGAVLHQLAHEIAHDEPDPTERAATPSRQPQENNQ